MRLGRRAPSSPTATPGASLPLRAQALVPFALALALVVAFAAVGAALVARSAVDRELGAQAGTARHLVVGQLETTRQRLSAEVAELGDGQARGSGRPLEEQLMAFSRREKLTLAAAIDEGGAPVGDGRLAWARLPFARALSEQARRAGKPISGTGRSKQDEPFVLSVAHDRSGRTFVVGRSVDRRMLTEVESNLTVEEISDNLNQLAGRMARIASGRSAPFQKIHDQLIRESRPGLMAGWRLLLARMRRRSQQKGEWENLLRLVPKEEQQELQELLVASRQRKEFLLRLIYQQRYKNILEFWLYIHVPFTIALLVFAVLHLVGVFYYGRIVW